MNSHPLKNKHFQILWPFKQEEEIVFQFYFQREIVMEAMNEHHSSIESTPSRLFRPNFLFLHQETFLPFLSFNGPLWRRYFLQILV